MPSLLERIKHSVRLREIRNTLYSKVLRAVHAVAVRSNHPVTKALLAENRTLQNQLDVTVEQLAQMVVRQTADLRALTASASDEGIRAISSRTVATRALATREARASKITWRPAEPPAISIVLGSYQRLPVLKKAIASIRNNGITVPYEIIVIDGGSTDQTPQWLMEQPDILTIVHHNRPGGKRLRSWGWFMNVAFRAAHGRCILMMSDDSVLVPGAVNAGLARIADAESAGRVIGAAAFYFRNWPKEQSYFVQKTIGGMLMVNHGIFLRDALEDVGFCEEEAFGFYKCDSDLALKLWRVGYEIIDCPDSFVEHLVLPDEEVRLQNNRVLERDRDILLERWEGVYAHRLFSEMFKNPNRVEKVFIDPCNTAETLEEFVPRTSWLGSRRP